MARTYHVHDPVTEHPTVMMAERAYMRPGQQEFYSQQMTNQMSIAAQANLQNIQNQQQINMLMGLSGTNPYANVYHRPPETTTADKLNEWYARLEARVNEIEADDGVMGKKETKRWMDELAAFKADLS